MALGRIGNGLTRLSTLASFGRGEARRQYALAAIAQSNLPPSTKSEVEVCVFNCYSSIRRAIAEVFEGFPAVSYCSLERRHFAKS